MKAGRLSVAIIIALSFMCITLFFNNESRNKVLKNTLDRADGFERNYRLMVFREKESLCNNEYKLTNNLEIFDKDKNALLIKDIIDEKIKLVIRYSVLSCDICFEEELKIIQNHIQKIGSENILIFALQENIKNLTEQQNSLALNIAMYITEESIVPFEETHSNLFLFVMDKDLIVKDFFIPEKTLPKLSETYYKTICSKYWEIKQ